MLRFRFLPLLLILLATASAQTFRGGINGSVTDVSGAAIPDAAVHESIRTQFRAEIFNLFNRTTLAPPAGTIGGGFGQSSDTIGDYSGSPAIGPGEPFNVQLALKILF
jgi:hypothetical protein